MALVLVIFIDIGEEARPWREFDALHLISQMYCDRDRFLRPPVSLALNLNPFNCLRARSNGDRRWRNCAGPHRFRCPDRLIRTRQKLFARKQRPNHRNRASFRRLSSKASACNLKVWIRQRIRHRWIAFRRVVPGRDPLFKCLHHNDAQGPQVGRLGEIPSRDLRRIVMAKLEGLTATEDELHREARALFGGG